MKKGIDISKHQGLINFDEVKEKFDFVMIRVAIGDDLSEDDSECSQCDKLAQHNIDECEARGIPYGLYIYSYATNEEEARNEARHIREWYNKCNASLGVWLDMEDADKYKEKHGVDYSETHYYALAWLDELSDIPAKGIYASHSWLNNYMNIDELLEDGADIWEAHWNNDDEICEESFVISQESSNYYLNDGTRIDYDIMRDEFYNKLINNQSDIAEDGSWSEDLSIRFIAGLYSAILGRDFNPDENPGLIYELRYNISRYQAFLDIFNSDEGKKKIEIMMMYLFMRGSLPSRQELDEWFNQDEIYNILYSEECNNNYNIR